MQPGGMGAKNPRFPALRWEAGSGAAPRLPGSEMNLSERGKMNLITCALSLMTTTQTLGHKLTAGITFPNPPAQRQLPKTQPRAQQAGSSELTFHPSTAWL